MDKPGQAQTPLRQWKFDEGGGATAFDSSGNGDHALLSSGIRWVAGVEGWAISANASNRDSVEIPPLDLERTKAVTIAFWVLRDYTTDSKSVFFEAGGNYQTSTTGFALLPDDETCHGIQAALRGNAGTTANCYSQPSSGVWHHFAVIYDKGQSAGNQVALYVDGVLQTPSWNLASATNTNNYGYNSIYLFSRGAASQYSSGTIADLRIYSSALTAPQVLQLYNGSELTAPTSPISYVQGNYATPQTPRTTVNVTFRAAQTAGDLNVVVVGWNDSRARVSSVRDSKGNLYTRAVGPTIQSGLASQSIYYAKNIVHAPAATNSVTVTFSTPAVYPDIRILEYRGADTKNPIDVTAANSGNSATSNSGWATTTNATDLIFGANLVQMRTTGPGSGFTQRLLTSPDGDIAEDQMKMAKGRYSATAPVTPPAPWIMQMVALRTPAGFSISASPASLTVAQGNYGISTITTVVRGNFKNSIALSASGMPSGTTVSFNPTTIPPPGSGHSTMTITVGSTTPAGTYPIRITGKGGQAQQTTTVTLTVIAPGFTISASPTSLTVAQGNYGESTITTTVGGGFNSSIALSASGMPSGTTVSFNPTTIPPPGSGHSNMKITVGSATPLGTYPITVTGTGGGIEKSTTLTLTVTTATQQQPTLVQHVTCPNSGGMGSGAGDHTSPTPSYICPLAEPTQSGNALVLGFFSDNSGNPTWTISDDKSNTWTLAQSTTDTNGNIIAVYYALNVAAGTRMITVKNSGGTGGYLAVSESEYYNVATSSALDTQNCNAGSSSTAITAGSITPETSGDLLWQYAATTTAAAVSSFVAGSQSNITWALNGTDILTGDATQAGVYDSTSAINPTFTSTGKSQTFDSCVIALKAASAGNAPTQSFRILHTLHAQLPPSGSSPFTVQMPTSGNLIVVSFISGGTTISNMISSPSNTWSSTGSAVILDNTASQIYYAGNATTSNTMTLTFTLAGGIIGSTFMIYDFTGAATSPFDVDSGGQSGDASNIVKTLTTCSNCLTPTVANDVILGNFGQEWCTATAIDTPSGALFDAATDNGNSINGPQLVDQNNGWFHYYDPGLSELSATWAESCGDTAESHWSGRLAAFKKAD
jgi:hypothetical protein